MTPPCDQPGAQYPRCEIERTVEALLQDFQRTGAYETVHVSDLLGALADSDPGLMAISVRYQPRDLADRLSSNQIARLQEIAAPTTDDCPRCGDPFRPDRLACQRCGTIRWPIPAGWWDGP